VFVIEAEWICYGVRTGYLNIMQVNFRFCGVEASHRFASGFTAELLAVIFVKLWFVGSAVFYPDVQSLCSRFCNFQ
jgi:hypothetical protein